MKESTDTNLRAYKHIFNFILDKIIEDYKDGKTVPVGWYHWTQISYADIDRHTRCGVNSIAYWVSRLEECGLLLKGSLGGRNFWAIGRKVDPKLVLHNFGNEILIKYGWIRDFSNPNKKPQANLGFWESIKRLLGADNNA